MAEVEMGKEVVTDFCNRGSVTSCTSLIPKTELWNALKSEFFWALYQSNGVSCVKLPLECGYRMFMKCKWTLFSYSQDNLYMQTFQNFRKINPQIWKLKHFWSHASQIRIHNLFLSFVFLSLLECLLGFKLKLQFP